MKDYVRISLEMHLFFARIMKEHSLFLEAGFVQKDTEWIRRADFFRTQFEDLLRRTVQMSNHMISGNVLRSEELVTDFTINAERKTSALSGLPIDSRITMAEKNLECGRDFEVTREMVQMVHRLNERAVWLLNGLIDFKERLLREVTNCRMFTANYPLLIDHILREAKLYRETVEGLMQNQKVCYRNLQNQEEFWNQIMMEHALFIRGLLDPTEDELIHTADDFAKDFQRLLERARKQDCIANASRSRERCENETREAERRECNECNTREAERRTCDTRTEERSLQDITLEKTIQLRDFKAAGTQGLLNCQIQSIILPLLADHVLREANHYIRIQEHGYKWQEG